MRRIFAVIFLAVLLYVIYFPLKKEDPRLVVYISIDQMRYDYLERFKDQFSESGFNLLVKKGAVFTNCNFEHYCTLTAPGHAALGTGCYAGKSGITGNSWYDIQNNHSGYCVDDKNYTGLAGEKAGAKSAEQLIISTLGDELKIKNPQSKVFGISSKDRAAILMTGKKADAAFWFNKENGEYISSTYYLNIMPEWVTKYNQWGFSDFYFDRQWNKFLAENAYQNCTEDDFPYEDEPGGMGRTFPHPLNAGMDKPGEIYYSNLLYSPFGDELTIKFCKTLIENEDLGDDSNTDLLCISLSCTDYIGHAWGPDSHEMLDMQVRLDRMLQQFFQYLDKEIGMRHMVIVLTADHGVAPIPEVSLKNGIEAGRIQPADVTITAENQLRNVFGNPPAGENWIVSTDNASIFLNSKFHQLNDVSSEVVQEVLKEALSTINGIETVISRVDLLKGTRNKYANFVKKAYHNNRSGEVIMIQKPYWIFNYKDGRNSGTTHGSPHKYDTHVPMIIFSNKIRPGKYNQIVGPADIAVTLADIIGVELPGERDGLSRNQWIKKEE